MTRFNRVESNLFVNKYNRFNKLQELAFFLCLKTLILHLIII